MFYMKCIFFLISFGLCFANDLTVTADEMKYNGKTKESFATGHAKAHLKKNNKEYILKAHSFKLKRDLNTNQNYESIQATGSVEFKTADYLLTAQECRYLQSTQIVHCYGDVSILDIKKENTIHGVECLFNLKEQNYTMKGSCAKETQTIIKLK